MSVFESFEVKKGDGTSAYLLGLKNKDLQEMIINSTFRIEDMISMGMLDGVTKIDKWGKSDDSSVASYADAWDGVGEYVFPTGDTITHIAGTDSSDNGKEIIISYQLLDGTEATQTAILANGGVYVALDVPCHFIWRMRNISSNNLNGNAIASVGQSGNDSDRKAYIINGNNQTEMCIYRIPKETVAFLKRGEVSMEWSGGLFDGTQAMRVAYRSRRPNEGYTVKKSTSLISTGTTVYQDVRMFKDVIPSFTELKISSVSSSDASVGFSGAFELELWPESYFTDAYLASIGQAGY